MTLPSGHRLGPYEIVAPLGAGGMGAVYRAKDTRLGRDVAIKVLLAHLSASPEGRARFEREAKTISSLSHPHICTLHDVGREGETDYLVMELVEGETLSSRLRRNALPASEVLRIGAQIADALDRAHRAGVVHRDLKPGNVMLTKTGAKLMDFGLARATGLGSLPVSPSGVTMQALEPLTAEGTIIGTFQYMSPEQLDGKEADARSDIWALGCVLYEMATGRRAFEGESQASLIGAIMSKEPASISQISPTSPPALDAIVRACLAKDPADRLQAAHDVKLQLDWIREAGSQAGTAAVPTRPDPVARSREWAAWAVAAAAVVAAAVAWLVPRSAQHAPPIWTTVTVPSAVTLSDYSCNVVISPTGRAVAFVGVDSTEQYTLWSRTIDSEEPKLLFHSDDAWWPFWSPDGEQIGFFDRMRRRLMRVPLAGGSPTVICEAEGDPRGGTWNRDGVIVFAPKPEAGLMRVAATGGAPQPLTTPDSTRGESGHRFPCFLPDGEHYLFTSLPEGPNGFEIHAASLERGVLKHVLTAESAPVYIEPGYLVFKREGRVLVQRFDVGRLELQGEPVAIADAPAPSELDADPVASASSNGLMTILHSERPNTRLEMVDRTGATRARYTLPAAPWQVLSLSRDGTRAAVGSRVELWVVDLERSVPMRLGSSTPGPTGTAWSPDGQRVAYVVRAGGREQVHVASVDGRSEALTEDEPFKRVFDWSPDGRHIVYGSLASVTSWDIHVIPLEGDRKPFVFAVDALWQFGARVSPDGRWIAYMSNESVRYEIYVQSFPEPGRKVRVTADGGIYPSWSRGRSELLYRQGPVVMAVPFEAGETFRPGTPRPLFTLPKSVTGVAAADDGEGFLVSTPEGDVPRDIRMIVNWEALVGR